MDLEYVSYPHDNYWRYQTLLLGVFVSNPILNELGGVNKAIYDISSKSLAIIEW